MATKDDSKEWVQIWGALFDMACPKAAEEVGKRIGEVEEVEKQ